MAEPGNPGSSHVARGHVPERLPLRSQAPLPGLGLGVVTALVSLDRRSCWLYLLIHARAEKGRVLGSSGPEAAFQFGVKTAACFPGHEHPEPGDPGTSHVAACPVPECQPRTSRSPVLSPGLGLATPLASTGPGGRIGCTCSSMPGPKRAWRGGPAATKQPSKGA